MPLVAGNRFDEEQNMILNHPAKKKVTRNENPMQVQVHIQAKARSRWNRSETKRRLRTKSEPLRLFTKVRESLVPGWHEVPGATGMEADHIPEAHRWNDFPSDAQLHWPSLEQAAPAVTAPLDGLEPPLAGLVG